MKSIEVSVRQKSIQLLKDNIKKYEDGKHIFYYLVLTTDEIIYFHLAKLHHELLEKNLIKIIEPYSVLEIEFIQKNIGLTTEEILNK